MRVLHLLSQLELTGAEAYAITLAEKQIDMGYDVYIMSDTINSKTRAKYIKLNFNRRGLYDRYMHIKTLTDFISQHKIDIVHSHSRASSWSGHISAKLTRVPHITSVHQILPGGFTKKLLPCLGDICLANCENVREAIIVNYSFPQNRIRIVRNAIDSKVFSPLAVENGELKVAIVGRYSGPKGRSIEWFLKDVISRIEGKLEPFEILIVSNKVDEISIAIDEISRCYKRCRISQLGFIDDIRDIYKVANVIIGAGRVAIESVCSNRCTLALGEKGFLGLITFDRIDSMEASSFGDCLLKNDFNIEFAVSETIYALRNYSSIIESQDSLVRKVLYYHNLESIVSNINELYSLLINYKKKSNI